MAEPGAVTRALRAVARDVGSDTALAERVCVACVARLDINGAAISLLTGSSSRETLWATGATASLLEDLQFTLNEGACMQAASTGYPVLVSDLRQSTEVARWPIFAAALIEQTNVRALFALPLQWGTVNLGVLDLYRSTPGELDTAQQRDAINAVETAALMMLTLRIEPGVDEPGVEGGPWLDHSSSYRAEVHQATGMVLDQLGISATRGTGPAARLRVRRTAAAHRRRPRCGVAAAGVHRGYDLTESEEPRRNP